MLPSAPSSGRTPRHLDPATGRSEGPDLLPARSRHTQLADGRYRLVGRVDDKHIAVAACEAYDQATGKFAVVGSLTFKLRLR